MAENQKCCCSGSSKQNCCGEPTPYTGKIEEWMVNFITTPAGQYPIVGTELTAEDKRGELKIRLGIGRSNYRIAPGLYGAGQPDSGSPVLVTANYKLSFDKLRQELHGVNAWILVLDTKGINVWCAAGKGTFSTDELVHRVKETGLAEVISHRSLILPQLGAPGVSAHLVTKATGFKVVYGPVRAADIKEFLQNGMTATAEMRRVQFTLKDRAILAPVELVYTRKLALAVFFALFVFAFIDGLSVNALVYSLLPYLGALVVGSVVVPVLLPWIPGRAFALKGWIMGLMLASGVVWGTGTALGESIVYFLTLPAITAYIAMKFTGASTFTSLSGVLKEMKYAVPLILVSAGAGVILKVIMLF